MCYQIYNQALALSRPTGDIVIPQLAESKAYIDKAQVLGSSLIEDNKLTGISVIVDYFRASFDLKIIDQKFEKNKVEELVKIICDFLNIKNYQERQYKKDRYKYAYDIGEAIELYMAGPKSKYGYPTCSILLKGAGCREFERCNPDKTWYDFILFFITILNATPSRIDLTVDDYDGEYFDFNWIKTKLDKGFYTSSFQKKYYKLHGCQEEGYSIEFGSHSSTQMLVIYEKLKEQKNKKIEVNADYWLRLEMRYMHQKALFVCLDLLNNIDEKDIVNSFNKYVFSILYQMLDIKADNNYSLEYQTKVETDLNWLNFLNDTDKIKINTLSTKKSLFESFTKHINQSYYMYFIVIYLISKKDWYTTSIRIIDDVLSKIDSLDKLKLNRINKYLSEFNHPNIKMTDILDIKKRLIDKQEDLRLPF